MHAAALAAHRFGYAETSLRPLAADPRGWVLAQFDAPAPLDPRGLAGTAEIAPLTRAVLQAALGALPAAETRAEARARRGTGPAPSETAPSMASPAADRAAPAAAAAPAPTPPAEALAPRAALRRANLAAWQRRWQQVIDTPTPVAERWQLFWSNHFSIAATKGATLGLVAPYEREAIRPHAFGRFAELLRAATLHAGMLLYLDNAQSIGPGSPAGRRRARGLNENLARELLELHTVGVHGGYDQRDVTELARLLTGWTVRRGEGLAVVFEPARHEPGPKTVLGRRYEEGPQAVDRLCEDLARHPATARFLATKLVRHFVADEPPAALVDAVAAAHLRHDGELRRVAAALFEHPLAWDTERPGRFKRPEELLLSAHRLLKLPLTRPERTAQDLAEMGQPPDRAPSPQGWPDGDADWLAPDALWKRVQWAAGMAERHGDLADARRLAALAWGEDLGEPTRRELDRAASGGQALALLLASPEFQRR
ncbi:DUF1800 domain-containing protein [Piscinibacter sakaiensis]|uniref:Uncharacterized protein n=1 Tax=Piscinibacter sakaiensis TaxID=1547922 RepID=A0A0K8NYJ4_PISS1|nr:DUF1800 domain-containing protein [Piscinibacter sakaiensis]GAP35443.1 hypothetical protein ISF6_1216 [Piscinibacter sakaiensis]